MTTRSAVHSPERGLDAPGGDHHGSAIAVVVDSVGDEVVEDPGVQAGIPVQDQVVQAAAEISMPRGVAMPCALESTDAIERRERHLLDDPLGRPFLGTHQHHQVLGDLGHVPQPVPHDLQGLPVLGGRPVALQRDVHLALQGRQGRAQFV